jgi:biopolymer transport protein TolR
MAMSTGGKGGVKAEPNVTPMIDVMLVLLIIFMLVIPAINSGFQAVPPLGQNLKPHPEEDTDQVLGIDAKGVYYLNKKPIHNEDLGPMLRNIFENREEDKILYIKAHKDLDYGKINDAMDVAAHNFVAKAALITDQRPGTVSGISSDNLAATGGSK